MQWLLRHKVLKGSTDWYHQQVGYLTWHDHPTPLTNAAREWRRRHNSWGRASTSEVLKTCYGAAILYRATATHDDQCMPPTPVRESAAIWQLQETIQPPNEHHHNDHQRAMKNDKFFYPKLLSELQKASQKYKTTNDWYATLTLKKWPRLLWPPLTPKSRRSGWIILIITTPTNHNITSIDCIVDKTVSIYFILIFWL